MHRTLVVGSLVSATTLAHADEPVRTVDGDSLGVVTFSTGSARLAERALDRLEDIAVWHAEHPDSLLFIEAQPSRGGSARANLRISQRRTDAVRLALVRAGADPSRMVLVARGNDGPAPARPRVVLRASGDFVALAREQREPEIGEDARAARRTTSARRSGTAAEAGTAAGATGDPAPAGTGDPAPAGTGDPAPAGAGSAAPAAAGTTIVVVPGGG
jgi:hypothetical protein